MKNAHPFVNCCPSSPGTQAVLCMSLAGAGEKGAGSHRHALLLLEAAGCWSSAQHQTQQPGCWGLHQLLRVPKGSDSRWEGAESTAQCFLHSRDLPWTRQAEHKAGFAPKQ